MKYKLVADSSCELVPELVEALDAVNVPLKMTLADETFVDDENLDLDDFLTKMNNFKGRALSACPSPQEYNNAFSKDKTNFVVTLSSQLSGSYSSAVIAKSLAAEEGKDVHVFDSKSATAGELLISLKIKELVERGLEKSDIIHRINDFISNMKTLFVLENLENLVKNGRMSRIKGTFATMLQIRAILGEDGNGNIVFVDKARGTANAIAKLVDTIGVYCKDTRDRILTITHCNNEPQALRVKTMAEEKYSFRKIFVVKTRGLSSMYANQGGVVIAF